jgi:hypothetical protein
LTVWEGSFAFYGVQWPFESLGVAIAWLLGENYLIWQPPSAYAKKPRNMEFDFHAIGLLLLF